ncbi:uncharacterized protein V6R79_017754 [Siganus canaliculatus]
MKEEMEQDKQTQESTGNYTTAHVSPLDPKAGFRGYYAVIPVVLLTLIGCVVATVLYIRRRARLDELRHRLIPLYSYDPAEEHEWSDEEEVDEELELAEPLYKDGRLSLSPYSI